MPVPKATGVKNGDNTFEKSLEDYGYLLVTATPAMLTIQFFEVKSNGTKKMFDKVSVDLKTSLIQ
jgi:RNase adaptor protein for sRNA GlmZ degradation